MTSIADLLDEEIIDSVFVEEGKEADFILDLSNFLKFVTMRQLVKRNE